MSDCDRCRESLLAAGGLPPAGPESAHLSGCSICRAYSAALRADQLLLRDTAWSREAAPADFEDVLDRAARSARVRARLIAAMALGLALVAVPIVHRSRGPSQSALPLSWPAFAETAANPFADSDATAAASLAASPSPLSNPFSVTSALPNPFRIAALEENPFTPEEGEFLADSGSDNRRF